MLGTGVQDLPQSKDGRLPAGIHERNKSKRTKTKVKDRLGNQIGAKGREPTDWNSIDWERQKALVRDLRQRIFQATKRKQWNKVRSLTKLMLRSQANLLLSVRRVTQENAGRKTPGVDKEVALTSDDRVKLIKGLRGYTLWKVRPTKRVYIPKANGKQRPLGIPTIRDRITQAIVKNALEPTWEARFEANSYGFRPGRSCHDAIEQCWIRLNSNGGHTWVLDADIKGAFDNISHDFILKAIGEIPGKELIKQWLKAGYVESEIIHSTESGTPQGGIISPLLANIALEGLENILSQHIKAKEYTLKSGKSAGKVKRMKLPRYGYIRYADDFVVTAETREEIEDILPTIRVFLAERGLTLNEEKTQIRNLTEGFNFLGFNIRQYGGKCLIKPQREKVIAKLREIKAWLKSHKTIKAESVIQYLNPILRGWANYYKHGVSSETFQTFGSILWKMLWKWAKRRHPKKGARWVKSKYFQRVNGDWVFFAKTKNRHGEPQEVNLYQIGETKITRHIKVKDKATPDDPELKTYWADRMTKHGREYWAKGSRDYCVAVNQNWKCPECNEHLFNGEKLHTHHKVAVKDGGRGTLKNLVHLHKECHKSVHGKQNQKVEDA